MQHRERSALLDLAHDSIIVISANRTIEFWNRGAEKLYGYTRQEAMGAVSYDLLRTQFPEPLDAIEQKLMSQSVWQGELVHTHKDGHPIIVSSRWALRRDANGRPNGFLEINRDITERKQAEEERRTLVALVENSTDFIAMASTDGRVLFVNRAGQEMVGLESDEQVRGTTVSDYHPAEDRHCQEVVYPALFRDGRWEGQALFRHFKTNLPIPMQQHIFLMQDPGKDRGTKMATICRDITASQRAEAALRESEERFRNMADTAPVMIWVSDKSKLCTFFNQTWLDFTGRTLEQELGSGWAEGIHPDDREACFGSYSAAFDARQKFAIEYRLRRADGDYRRVLCSGVPRFEPGGVFAGYIGSDVDITDVRRAQEEAFERQKLESLGVLTGGIAHDFNNLLGSILADAELALAEIAANSSAVEEIQRIRAVAIRASEIVRELMIYSGQDKATLEPVDVSRLVEEMLELLKVSISKRAVLNADLHRNLPAVRGNATQIRQVVMNLMINASEAIGEKGGAIRVTTSRVTGGQDSVTDGALHLPEGDYLRLSVSDTGCGMTEEQKARIFDPFFTTKFAGRGLGLAVVQGIVRAHSGAIHLVSAPGQGTTFEILLPCDREPKERDQRDALPAAGNRIPGVAGTVLLVEDEGALRFSVAKMLRKQGYSVIEAADGSAAMDLFRGHKDRIDVILLDMTIPGISSRDVIAEAGRIGPGVKVILTTAYSREMATASLTAPQVRGFIRKPFRLGELIELLRDVLAA